MNWEESNIGFFVSDFRFHVKNIFLHSLQRIVLLLVLVILSTGIIFANDGDSFLKNGDYDKAITSYELQVKEGFLSHELFFNLATAYQKTGNIPLAVLNFEKALRLKPLDQLTTQQLVQLNLQLQDKPVIYDDAGLLAIIKKVQFGLGIDAWAFLSIFFMLLVPIVIFVSYKYKKWKFRKIVFISSLVWFLLSGVCVIMARNNYHYKYLHTEAVVLDESLIVYDSPNTSSKINLNVHAGTKLEVNDSTDLMYNIQFSGNNGWVLRKGVKMIEL